MARQWVGQEPPEFPRDAAGLSAFRQRWHSFMAWFTDAVRRLFLHSKEQDATLDEHETRIDSLEALGLTVPVPIAKGGTGQTGATEAFDALAPTKSKGDLIARGASDNVRVAVGTDGYPLIADAASAGGVKWATTKEDLSWWVGFDRRPFVGSAASSPPTLGAADASINDSTSASASAGRDATDANVTWFLMEFAAPNELDKTEAVSATVYFRLASNAGSGNQIEFTTRLRFVTRDEHISAGGGTREASGTAVLTGYTASDLGYVVISGAIAANDLADNDYVHGVLERDATAGNGNDTYAAAARVQGVKFTGKRKVRT